MKPPGKTRGGAMHWGRFFAGSRARSEKGRCPPSAALSEMQCTPAPLLSEFGSYPSCWGVKIVGPQSGTTSVLLAHHNQCRPFREFADRRLRRMAC
jgi:hypothetical protein